MLHPIRRFFQRIWIEPARTPLRDARLDDEPCALQHFEVFGYSRQGHRFEERLSKISDARVPNSELRQDRPTGGIGEGRKGVVQVRHEPLIIPIG